MTAPRRRAGSARSLLPAALTVLGGAAALTAAAPPYGSADEAAHVDYALQVWQGRLPVFEDGLVLALEHGARPPVQWTAQHPPLFYALTAPVIGPLAEAGHPVLAAFAGRAVTALLALLTVLTVAWAARWVTGRTGMVPATAAVVAAADVWVLRLGAAVYNDILLVLLVTALLGLTARLVRLGRLTVPWLALWAVLPCAAASSRASGVPIALLALAVAAVAALRGPDRARRFGSTVLLPLVVLVVGAGWFYARNVRLAGSWTGTQPEWAAAHLERRTVPVTDVVTNLHFWRGSFRQLGFAPGSGDVTNYVLFAAPALVGVGVVVLGLVRQRSASRRPDLMIAALLVGTVGGVTLQQALYTAQGGGVNGRYLAVLLLPFAVAVALGLAALPGRWAAAAAVVWAALRALDLGLDVRSLLVRFGSSDLPSLPSAVAWAGVAVAATGLGWWAVRVASDGRAAPGAGTG